MAGETAGVKRVVALMHATDPPGHFYLIRQLAPLWQATGIGFEAVYGVDRFVEADLAILHVNLTHVPQEYLDFADRYPRTLNRAVVDISKRSVSTMLVGPGDSYDGPVIVKANLNNGGIPETRLGVAGPFGKLRLKLNWKHPRVFKRSLARTRFLQSRDYRVFDHVSQVPPGVFKNPALVVERFLPEREGDLYCIRHCHFLGDRHHCEIRKSRSPIVKSSNTVDRERVPVPEELLVERERRGFDFGKFDYVVHDDGVHILDVNRTPGGLRGVPLADELFEGVRSFL